MKRTFDLILSSVALLLLGPAMLAIGFLVRYTSRGPAIYWSDRVGRGNNIFKMPKFRTMQIDTPELATHLIENPKRWVTPVGRFLRKTSLDELPQLWSILVGHMSFVGPRPALFNQYDLITLRTNKSICQLTPGLTGWAQINGRDGVTISEKVEHDVFYLYNRSFWLDLKIITKTCTKVLRREGVDH